MRGQAPLFPGSRHLPSTGTRLTLGGFRARAARVAAASLPVLAVLVVSTPAIPAHASAATITAPTYVRTIGSNGESTMYPSGVAVDASGNVYVADTGNYRIEKYQAGTTTLLWSVGVRGANIGGGTDSFIAPRDVATDGTFVYVGDTDNADVQVLNASDGSFVKMVKTFGTGGTQTFQDPIGISVGHNASHTEEILVSDGVSGNVYVFDTSMTLQFTVAPTAKTGTGNKGFSREGFVGQFYFGEHADVTVVTQHGEDSAWFGQGYGDYIDSYAGNPAATCASAAGPVPCNNVPGTQLASGSRNPTWKGVLVEPHYVYSPQLLFLARYETIRMSQQSTPGTRSDLGNITTYTVGYRYNPFMTSRAGFAWHNPRGL